MISDLIITPLKIIDVPGGNVLHALKNKDLGFNGFGEAYFSEVELMQIKAWKRHRKMTLNLIVPIGEIRFIVFDDRTADNCVSQEITLSRQNYCRLTIPPMVWVGFQGRSKTTSMLLNIADLSHDPNEVDRKDVNQIALDWST